MQFFDYQSEDIASQIPATGLILLQTDEVLEGEIGRFLDAPMRWFHTRVPSGADVTTETLARMESEIAKSASLLPAAAGISVVAYCCTSGTTVIGEEKVASEIRKILPGVAVTNPLTAVKARLDSLGAKRVALLTPYEPKVSQAIADHLEKAGYIVTRFGSFNEKEEAKVTRISRQSILNAMDGIGSGDDCDCVFASCTNLRTVDLVAEAENRIAKPVISSNSALAWHIGELTASQAARDA